jgi:hypothetical protein
MRKSSRSVAPILVPALVATVVIQACSDGGPVDSSRGRTFKEMSCFDFSDYLHTVSLVETPGWASAVVMDGPLAYIADGNNGLEIVDFDDPSVPLLRGGVRASEPVVDVAATPGIACLSLGTGGVAVVDVGDPDRPVIVGRVDTPGSAQGIAMSDTIAYVADDVVGVMLIGIAKPDAPLTLGVDNTPGKAVDVAVSGPFAYVADLQNGLRVVNVDNPSTPWWVNTIALPFGGSGVDVAGDLVFVAGGAGGLQIVDVSTPGAEAVVGSLATRGVASQVAIDSGDDVAFVAQGRHGVVVVDVSDPADPKVVNVIATSAAAAGVATDGGFTLVAEGFGGLRAVITATPQAPPVTARLSAQESGAVSRVVAGPGVAYGAGPAIGLLVVEAGESALQPLGSLTLPYEAADLAVVGDSVFVASEDGGIEMVDVGDPAAPRPAGWAPYSGSVVSLEGLDGFLYFTGGQRFGTWRPGDEEATTIDLLSAATSAMAVEGAYAYVGDRANSIHGVNIEVPERPIKLFVKQTMGACEDMVARDGYLFIATSAGAYPGSENGVEVYDIHSPLQAVPVSFVRLSGRPYRAALANDAVYVADGVVGLVVIDVSDPANPLRVGSVPSGDASTGAAVVRDVVFVADGTDGLFALPAHGCLPSP